MSSEYYTHTDKLSSQGNAILNRLKVTTPIKNSANYHNKNIDESKVSSILMNGSFFADGTK
jgi:hypothetical protein